MTKSGSPSKSWRLRGWITTNQIQRRGERLLVSVGASRATLMVVIANVIPEQELITSDPVEVGQKNAANARDKNRIIIPDTAVRVDTGGLEITVPVPARRFEDRAGERDPVTGVRAVDERDGVRTGGTRARRAGGGVCSGLSGGDGHHRVAGREGRAGNRGDGPGPGARNPCGRGVCRLSEGAAGYTVI
ncbi:hypothetical protein B0H17DRAFT_1139876 [Mycena rosella]|uniref:Uncharacterized protein n=1 Tax=Mycena rosella TaxID=1033263 RepID=A0AAD7D347_MYCRO|nr:hypothetical protein B0H17DRAFT_1139876 [Mycena rosella]